MRILSAEIVDKPKRPIKIVQIGEGNFLRAFVDYFINELNKETDFNGSIAMVQPRDSHKIGRFNEQDCLYTVVTESLKDGCLISESDIIDCIDCVIDPYTNYNDYLELAKSRDVQVVISNTTEGGLYYEEKDTDLSITPKSFPAKLLAFLKIRYDHFDGDINAGMHIIPCETLSNNGGLLKEILHKLALNNSMNEDFISWMLNANKFYNNLVDRIVPGIPDKDIERWQKKWGYIDNLAVRGENFHLWCIEGDKSLLDVLPFDKTNLNILICDDISPYEERKIRILNGIHTFMASVAYLNGYKIVNRTVSEKWAKDLLDKFLYEEVMPSITKLKEHEKISFKNDVLARFSNPTIDHKWEKIMLNYSSKYKFRILPVIKYHDKICKYCLFAMASMLAIFKYNVEHNNKLFSDEFKFMNLYNELFGRDRSSTEIINRVMDLDYWEYSFSDDERNLCIKAFDKITTDGMESAIQWIQSL